MKKPPKCREHDDDCVAVKVESRSAKWEETDYSHLEHLSREEAEWMAESEAERLSAHWGHVRIRRWGKGTWKVWEPGEEWVEGWVRVVPHPDRWEDF